MPKPRPRIHEGCRNCDGDGIMREYYRDNPDNPNEITSIGLGVCRSYQPAPAAPELPKPLPRKRAKAADREAAGQARLDLEKV